MKKIIVVGCGISGLSSALVLARAGYEVKIFAKQLPPHTTSNKAAAFWSPYYANGIEIAQWSKESYLKYEDLSLIPASGVSMTKLHRYKKNSFHEAEDWEAAIPERKYFAMAKAKLPEGYDEGFEVEVPLIETQIFLPYLMNEFREAGGKIFQHNINSLDELRDENEIIINCTGLASHQLADDKNVFPMKGQVAMMDVHLNIPIILDESEPTYIVQRQDGCIIGGTREENVYTETTDETTLKNILDRASKFFPELKSAKRITQWAGLRPYRHVVRVEREGNVIHNYGHGGSGFTLAWGCANEVLRIAETI